MGARLGRVIASAVLVAAVAAICLALFELARVFETADTTVKAAVVGGVFAVCVGLLTYVSERNKARAEAHRQKKVEIYSKFVALIFRFFSKTEKDRGKSAVPSDEFTRVMMDLKRDMILWSSPNVINTFTAYFRAASKPVETNLDEHSTLLSNCIRAMRHDIGLSNFRLSRQFFVEWIIQDPAELEKFKSLSKNA